MAEGGKLDREKLGPLVLEVIAKQLKEMSSQRALAALNMNSSLDRDLGLDSLSRAELITRLEKEFGIDLPDSAVMDVLTPGDLVGALLESPAHARAVEGALIRAGGASGVPPAKAGSLIEVLDYRAGADPSRCHIALHGEDGSERPLSYGQLLEGGRDVAAGLIRAGLKPGETAAIMLPTGEEFFLAFFGILLAGGIPVPIYPPFRPDRIAEYVRRQSAILSNAGAAILISFTQVKAISRMLVEIVPGLRRVDTLPGLRRAGKGRRPGFAKPESGHPALIQYTSGSTGTPKGVVLTHANLLANIRALGETVDLAPTDVGVSWLPLYHDMGLIGAWLGALYHGLPVTIMSPLAFIARPSRWLWAIHAHRASVTAAPNFAYELCARRIPDDELEGLDLSCVRLMFNGAEPVSPGTLERFAQRFAPLGFRPSAMTPVYGLAENSLCLTCPPLGREPVVDAVSRHPFADEGRAEPAGEQDTGALRFVSCGVPLVGHEVRLVDDDGIAIADERRVGRLEFRGPSSSRGYYRPHPGEAPLVRDGWLDSGDLAYIAKGEVYVTGRSKDLIIKGGRNITPHELEEVASGVPGVRRGCVAAFGVTDEAAGTEQVVVVAETRETREAGKAEVEAGIVAAVTDQAGIPPDAVVLVAPGSVPKTSSGKISRSACRAAYISGDLGAGRAPAWAQFIKLTTEMGLRKTVRLGGRLLRLPYAAYVGMLAIVAVAVLAAFSLLAGRGGKGTARMRSFLSGWARWVLRLGGITLQVEGTERLHAAGARILVANHASYADVLVLLAALPPGFAFLAKRELLGAPLIGGVIRKSGHLTVDRLDPSRAEATREVVEALGQGSSVLIFPEGTFTQATGLRPFALGAFAAAVESQAAILPVSLNGTRRILRAGQWLPRPGRVAVTVGEPIQPEGQGWREAIRLRDLARARIVRNCGEPILDLTETGFTAA